MKVTKCAPEGHLPAKHFAILFEGAWLFTPEGSDKILATCPIVEATDPGHGCTFGLWSGRAIDPLEGFDTTTMREKRHFHVSVNGFKPPENDFDSLFTLAAANYPFVYLPPKGSELSNRRESTTFSIAGGSTQKAMRRVSIPLPNEVIADGALITAEIDGPGISDAFGAPVSAKRPVVAFIFVYEYCGETASAEVRGDHRCASITAHQDRPSPHLIFNIHPGMSMDMDMDMDDAAQKCHTIRIFETLRQTISKTVTITKSGKTSSAPCGIAVYHSRDKMEFGCGNSGLTKYELGLAIEEQAAGPKLASCAGGGIAAHTS